MNAQEAPLLEIENLSKIYRDDRGRDVAVGFLDVNLTIEQGDFVCVVGPSGCGKTTLLRTIAGLMPATAGEIRLDGEPVTGPPRKVAFVFQDYARSLLPWMTALKNVVFPLRYTNMPKEERERVAMEALEAVGLGHAAHRYPWQMSGGMQQRVAIARAVAYQPEVLLMDEPFAAVDAQTRAELEDLMLSLQSKLGVTVVFVTHDIDEAVYLSDKIVILHRPPHSLGRVVDVPLSKPRSQIETKIEPGFAELRASIWQEIAEAGQEEIPALEDLVGYLPA
ncbi:ABC transporter ATP-binding protein [Microbacterium sp. NPDC096154]|uniref:ABC transporter ATP-binding protein n=1 Tax=Microbacterium sp. NPDC096154 TaxID=3155549 RepID=UPI0033241A48